MPLLQQLWFDLEVMLNSMLLYKWKKKETLKELKYSCFFLFEKKNEAKKKKDEKNSDDTRGKKTPTIQKINAQCICYSIQNVYFETAKTSTHTPTNNSTIKLIACASSMGVVRTIKNKSNESESPIHISLFVVDFFFSRHHHGSYRHRWPFVNLCECVYAIFFYFFFVG